MATHTTAIQRVDERLVLDGLYHWATSDQPLDPDMPDETISATGV